MEKKRRYAVIAAGVLLSLTLVAGAAFAAGAPKAGGPKAGGKMGIRIEAQTDGEKETLQKLGDLRKQQMEKNRAEVEALVNQAVTEGKVTRERADQFLQGHRPGHHGPKMQGGFHGRMPGPKTVEELKAKLDEAVKSGRLTQEQADAMVKHWEERANKTK